MNGRHNQDAADEAQPIRRGAHAERRDELCLLPLHDRLAHFAKREAYDMPDGSKLRMQPPKPLPKLNPSAFYRDTDGVFHLKKGVNGLPCLGLPTARYLHGYRDYLIGESGKAHLTRCHRCPLKDLCSRICDEVLHHSGDEVTAAWRRFMDFGGWPAVLRGWNRQDVRGNPAANRLRELVDAIGAAGVKFANDEGVRESIERRKADARAYAAERQHKARMARKADTAVPSSGETVPVEDLLRGAKSLRARVETLQASEECPRRLVTADAALVARVWAIREHQAVRGKKHGATHIAQALTQGASKLDQDAMRKRVDRVLKVLPRIEALP